LIKSNTNKNSFSSQNNRRDKILHPDKYITHLPLDFIQKAVKCSASALKVALHVQYLMNTKESNTFTLESSSRKYFGLSKSTSWRGMMALQKAGLIIADRKHGRLPIITVVERTKNDVSESVL